jgi:hypothetical protein
MLESAPVKQRKVIVRPHGSDVSFIQLDDLKAENLAGLAPAVFLALETSPETFRHGWHCPGRRTKASCAACAKEPAPIPLPAAPSGRTPTA